MRPGLGFAACQSKKGNTLIIRLLPFLWRMVCVCRLTQGAALGYVLLPLRGVPFTTFDTPSTQSANNMAAWGGCVGMAGMPYPPINTSAPTDADVCVDRCEPCREDFLALASGKAERSTSFYHTISSTI